MTKLKLEESARGQPRLFYGYIMVAAALFIMTIIFGAYHSFGVFFNPVLAEFGWARSLISGAFSLSTLMAGLFGTIMGWVNDKLGPRIVLSICGCIFCVGMVLMSRLTGILQLYLLYGILIGIAIGGCFVPLTSTTIKWFDRRRSMMTGIVTSGIGMGTLIMPPIANWLILNNGWRLSYIILGCALFIFVVPVAQILRRDPYQIGQLPYGFRKLKILESEPVSAGHNVLEAAKTRQFWLLFCAFFCGGFCFYAIVVHVAPHAIVLGLSSTSAATILATLGGMNILGKVVLGTIADRIGNKHIIVLGFVLMAVALFWLVFSTELLELYLFAIMFGFAMGGVGVSEAPLVASIFGLRSHGSIFGIIDPGLTLGATISSFLAGYIFDATQSYQVAFLICAGAAIIGLLMSTMMKSVPSVK